MAKNIAYQTKCRNILEYDFVNEIASNISPEKKVMTKNMNKDKIQAQINAIYHSSVLVTLPLLDLNQKQKHQNGYRYPFSIANRTENHNAPILDGSWYGLRSSNING